MLYLAKLDSTPLSLGSSMALLGSTWLYLSLFDFTIALLGSTLLNYTLPWLYLAILDSTTLYHGTTFVYLTVLPLLHSTMALLGSIRHSTTLSNGLLIST